MLLAEIHGHAIPEARDNEDHLTSTVFGHLRYLSPDVFWREFFARARSLPDPDGEKTLAEMVANCGCNIHLYSKLRLLFWPRHPGFGTPDMMLCFTGQEQPPLVLIVEAKLWAQKSGSGEHDQLGRYLAILSDLSKVEPALSEDEAHNAIVALLYLTPRESVTELVETAALTAVTDIGQRRLFRAQWQDIIEAARDAISKRSLGSMTLTVLGDVTAFLRHRGLEYFNGFRILRFDQVVEPHGRFYSSEPGFTGLGRLTLKPMSEDMGRFYNASNIFNGFQTVDLESFSVKCGGWINA